VKRSRSTNSAATPSERASARLGNRGGREIEADDGV
jgi:hypothetical protein